MVFAPSFAQSMTYHRNKWLSTEALAGEFEATLTTQPRRQRQALYGMAPTGGTVVAGPCESGKKLNAACLHLLDISRANEKAPRFK
jgi:hypothetical protein